ncbi:HAMP domain-containing sensor histidine kinase [Pseudonocardia eucalypti]|uniref:histidine kinase n=1 Tax=Pseudonocardia eucalypti TaxID=648755 RepID=A0ABP9R5G5_9PSEU|nr:signal transduction histidine kinase [Pseudonocardia eucalypti]
MRRRLLVTVMVLVATVLVGLGVPLAVTGARAATQRLFQDRLIDTVRFASLAQRPLVENDLSSFTQDIRRYDEVHDITVALVVRGPIVLTGSRPLDGLPDPDRVGAALAGRRSEPYPTVWPWQSDPMLLAEPVVVDGDVRGAVVTVSPTGATRENLLVEWLVVLVGAVIALGLAALGALPVVRWIMRPVQRLDTAMVQVASAALSGRPVEPVGEIVGPPELRRLTRTFDQMTAEVSRVLATQRAFVADASHQLRNFLQALRSRMVNLAGGGVGGPGGMNAPGEEYGAAMEELDRLERVLFELLELAKAEGSPTDLHLVDLDAAVAKSFETWQVLAEDGGVRLCKEGITGLSTYAPAGAMDNVLDPLLDNAIKFSPAGTEITVRIDLDQRLVDDPYVVLTVCDHGPGMPANELERATDRFWRSPNQHNVDGTGLGLAIAQAHARRCAGDLQLELPEGGGLRVVVRLPAAASPNGDTAMLEAL